MLASTDETSRRGLRVRGTVQGVGFRPFVHRLASEHALSGIVRNDEEGVWIEVEGSPANLAGFEEKLRVPPSLARITSVDVTELVPRGALGFRIVESTAGVRGRSLVPGDSAPCADCLRELLDPCDRRYRYPFINCTACGPRYTIVRDLPYDRGRTTMAAFTLCAACRAEYEDPRDRRFHAEPNACPACGPSVRLTDATGVLAEGDSALVAAARAVADGRIVAVKGVGGFLLAVNARDDDAARRLRARKHRPHKPLAVMGRDLGEIERVAHLTEAAREALSSPARPVVLVPRRDDVDVAPSVAPGLREIGVMLPSTPLHVLLLGDGPPLQIMTSGNVSDEPVAMDDDDALRRLSGIADLFLLHDRAIHTRADDSVVRVAGSVTQAVRRARGFVPAAVRLASSGPSILAVGADLKNAICITRENDAFLSQHIGDLASPIAHAFFEETISKLGGLLGVTPTVVAHDLHPEYEATRWAMASGLERVAVQHHHAHVASCLVEHGHAGPAIGVAFDGTGCGPAGDLWGGEILLATLDGFRRAGHLRPIALAGGEAAIRQPWRLGLAALLDAGAPLSSFDDLSGQTRGVIAQMIARGVATPASSGAGRWFDAVAAILGVRREISYEGQAAIELEAIAATGDHPSYPFAIDAPSGEGGPFVVDLRPTVRALADDVARGISVSRVAARFHETMARAVLESCRRVRESSALPLVALSGGCFQSARLTRRAFDLLTTAGFEVLIHRNVPPNDGGIALGQAAIASSRLRRQDGTRRVREARRAREERAGSDVPRNSR